MSAAPITEFAPAKVNLTLRVGPVRPDGYHPVDSLVCFADWGDVVRVEPADGLIMTMSGPQAERLEGGNGNLVLRAACALQAASGRYDGAKIHLQKELPVEAGLGGGSADAAAALRALNQLWELGFTEEGLARIGLDLGSDVPACVWSRPLRMRGRGEEIELVRGVEFAAILVNPGLPLATGGVFAAFDAGAPEAIEPAPSASDIEAWVARDDNDLEAAAISRQPAIADVLDLIDSQPGCWLARMSGSGATCFGLFDSCGQAEEAASAIAASRPGWLSRAVMLGGGTR